MGAQTLAAKGGAAFKAGELDEAASLFSQACRRGLAACAHTVAPFDHCACGQALEIVERNGEVTVDSKHALVRDRSPPVRPTRLTLLRKQ